MSATIRLARARDAAAIAGIYAPFCEGSIVSFETVAPSPEEFVRRIAAITEHWPWLVLEEGHAVAGYAYASRHHERAAYGWAVNTGIYVGEGFRGRGVGRALYTSLFGLLRHQGYFKACAGITLPNTASVALHEAFGFALVGVYRGIGFKLGGWHDVAWYEAEIQPEIQSPSSPRALDAVMGTPGWNRAIAVGLETYGTNHQR